MKRFTTLALVILALAAVPAAFGDDGGAQQQAPAARAALKTRVEIVRLRVEIVKLRYRLHCHGGKNADECSAFAQKVVDRLTTLDGNVQKRIDTIEQSCTSTSTDGKCKNADKKLAFLQKVDTHLQNLIKRIQDKLAGAPAPTSSTSDSSDAAVDQAASQLGQLAGSNG
jgi:hypothetical protein